MSMSGKKKIKGIFFLMCLAHNLEDNQENTIDDRASESMLSSDDGCN